MTRLEQLRYDSETLGMVLGTWSPGDGVTRYRFGPRELVGYRQYVDGLEHVTIGRTPNTGDYFGMARVFHTALGLGAAEDFIRGVKAGRTLAKLGIDTPEWSE